MTQSTPKVLTIRESRWIPWLVLPVFAGIGVLLFVEGNFVIGTIFLVSAIYGVLVLGPGIVATVDPLRASVVIKRRSFFRPPILTEIPFNDIASVAIEEYQGSKGGKIYKLVLVRQTGEHTALLDSSSSDLSKYKQQGQQINALLGVKERPVPIVEPKISDQTREGRSGDITWRLQTLSSSSAAGLTRWSTTTSWLPGQFIALCQKPADTQPRSGTGIYAATAPSAFIATYLRPLQLDSSELPGLDQASYVADLEPRLSTHFFTLSSNAEATRAWLTPPVVDLLVAWAERHPMPRIQTLHDDQFTLLTVLASPNGLWVMCQSALKDPAKMEELVTLGVGLVEAKQE